MSHPQAGATVIGKNIQDHPIYRPIHIIHNVRREQGVKISDSNAWRAKENALAIINDCHEEALSQSSTILF